MTTAAIYTRVSTGAQETKGTSLASQEDACRAYATEKGYVVSERHVYVEVHTGVELWERPQLTLIREAFKRREFDVLVVYETSRFGRDPIHLGVVLAEASHHGVQVEFVSEVLDTSPEGMLIHYVRGYAAQMEHMKIRERSYRGRMSTIRAGRIWGGSPLYGYATDRTLGKRVIIESEADVVREIFTMYAETGMSMRAIVQHLNDAGVPAPSTGKRQYKDGRVPRWLPTTVRDMLRREAYTGVTYAWRYRDLPNGSKAFRPREEWIKMPDDTTPAIISPDLYRAVQRRLDRNAGDFARNQHRPVLLRGLAHCALCGARMYVRRHHDGGLIYVCKVRTKGIAPCPCVQVRADGADAWAWATIRSYLLDPDEIEREIRKRHGAQHDAQGSNTRALRRRLTDLSRAQERLMERYTSSENFPWELVEREVQRIEGQKADVRAALTKMESIAQAQAELERHVQLFRDWQAHVAANLDSMTFDERRRVLETLGAYVTMTGTDWHLTLNPVHL